MASDATVKTPLSRTCQTCATAKVKCSRTKNEDICDRCLRLGKECVYRQASRRFKGWKKDARIEALEAKINELMTVPDASHPPGSSNASFRDEQARSRSQTQSQSPPYGTENESEAFSSDYAHIDPVTAGYVSIETADMLLEDYKSTMAQHFPFVIVAPQTTAEQLRREKPFLLLTILAAASYNHELSLQRELGKEVKRHICSRMIIEADLSLEMLQGLLIHLGWRHFYSRPKKHSHLVHLAISVVSELRLYCRPHTTWSTVVNYEPDPGLGGTVVRTKPPTREEHRAFIGAYYLSSIYSKLLHKVTMPKYSYLEECCQELFDNPEYPTDRYLKHIIKLQSILDQIDHLSVRDHTDLDVLGGDSPSQLYVNRLKTQLDDTVDEMPFAPTESSIVCLQLHTCQLYLYQVSVLGAAQLMKTPSATVSKWRADVLCAGLSAARGMLDFFINTPLDTVRALTHLELIQMGFGVIIACKLSVTAACPIFRRETAGYRTALAMPNKFELLVGRLAALTTDQTDLDGDADPFHDMHRMIARLQTWFLRQGIQDLPAVPPTTTNTTSTSASSNAASSVSPPLSIPQLSSGTSPQAPQIAVPMDAGGYAPHPATQAQAPTHAMGLGSGLGAAAAAVSAAGSVPGTGVEAYNFAYPGGYMGMPYPMTMADSDFATFPEPAFNDMLMDWLN